MPKAAKKQLFSFFPTPEEIQRLYAEAVTRYDLRNYDNQRNGYGFDPYNKIEPALEVGATVTIHNPEPDANGLVTVYPLHSSTPAQVLNTCLKPFPKDRPYTVHSRGVDDPGSKIKLPYLINVYRYVKDRWQGPDFIDGKDSFHTDYTRYTLEGCTLADLGKTEIKYDTYGDKSYPYRTFTFHETIPSTPVPLVFNESVSYYEVDTSEGTKKIPVALVGTFPDRESIDNPFTAPEPFHPHLPSPHVWRITFVKGKQV